MMLNVMCKFHQQMQTAEHSQEWRLLVEVHMLFLSSGCVAR